MNCIIWSLVIFIILKYAITKYGFTLKDSRNKISKCQIVVVIGIALFFIISKYISWGGFKLLVQHSYYFFEVILFTLIIVFGQKSFEKWFKNEKNPYGGIICSLAWG